MAAPNFQLADGYKVPALAFGSGTKLKLRGNVVQLISNAIKLGFRHIDCSELYGSESEVGEAIKVSGVKREDLFLTTKVYSHLSDPVGSLNASLKRLEIEYADLYLIHSPFVVDGQGTTIEKVWKAMESACKEGKAKSIGVSNFRVDHLERILAIAEIKPAVNQIEFGPYLQNQTLGITDFCCSHGILIEAYSPMAVFQAQSGPLLPILDGLSRKYGKSPSQIVLRWIYQQGVLSITSTVSDVRAKEALEAYDFVIDEEDQKKITEVGASHVFQRYPEFVNPNFVNNSY